MKILSTVFLLIAFLALGGSFFMFSKITGKLDEQKVRIDELMSENQTLGKERNEMEQSLNIAAKRNQTLSAENDSKQASLDRATEASQRTRDNLSAANREISSLQTQIADLQRLNKTYEDAIKTADAESSRRVFTQLEELRNEINEKNERIQEYQDQVAELEGAMKNFRRGVDPSKVKAGESAVTELLALDLQRGIVVVDGGFAPGTKLTLRNMGFPIADISVSSAKDGYSVANILPGLNRLNKFSVGDQVEFTLLANEKSS